MTRCHADSFLFGLRTDEFAGISSGDVSDLHLVGGMVRAQSVSVLRTLAVLRQEFVKCLVKNG